MLGAIHVVLHHIAHGEPANNDLERAREAPGVVDQQPGDEVFEPVEETVIVEFDLFRLSELRFDLPVLGQIIEAFVADLLIDLAKCV